MMTLTLFCSQRSAGGSRAPLLSPEIIVSSLHHQRSLQTLYVQTLTASPFSTVEVLGSCTFRISEKNQSVSSSCPWCFKACQPPLAAPLLVDTDPLPVQTTCRQGGNLQLPSLSKKLPALPETYMAVSFHQEIHLV